MQSAFTCERCLYGTSCDNCFRRARAQVLTGSQAVRQANLRAGFGVAAVAGKAAAKLEPKEVAELVRVSPRPMEVVFRFVGGSFPTNDRSYGAVAVR